MSYTEFSAQTILLNLMASTMSTPTWPSYWYVGLSTTYPSFSKGSAPYWNFTEPTDPSYTRRAATFAAAASQPSSAYLMQTTNNPAFGPASQSWNTIVAAGVFDAQQGGNLWHFFPIVRTTSDGAVTAGSATVTSASIGFTASDVGAAMFAPGVPVGAVILSVQSATSATMSANANVTGTALALAVATPQSVGAGESTSFPVGPLVQLA